MRKLNKQMTVAALIAATVGTLVPASQALARGAQPVSITFSIPYGNASDVNPISGLVDLYNKTHNGVQVKLLTNTTTQKEEIQLASGTASDLVMFGSAADFGAMAYNGAIIDLNPLIAKNHFNLQQLVKLTVDAGRLLKNHHVYALTYLEDTYEPMYNKTLFKQAGIQTLPTSLNEMVADAKKLTKFDSSGNIVQLGLDPGINGHDYQLFDTFGAPMFNATGTKSIIDNAVALKALQWQVWAYNQLGGYQKIQRFYSTWNAGGGNSQQNSDADPFSSGKMAMTIGADYYTDKLHGIAPNLNFGEFLLPAPNGGPNTVGSTSIGGNPVAISKDSQHPDQAWQFLSWMLTTGQNYAVHHNMLHGNFSATPNLIQDLNQPALEPNPHFRWFWTVLKTDKNIFYSPAVANQHDFLDIVDNYLNQVYMGQLTPAQGLQKIQDDENRALQRAATTQQ